MSDMKLSVTSGEVALVNGVAKTVLQIKAATNQRIKASGITVSFKGVDPTNAPVRVKVQRTTTDGASTSVTPKKKDPAMAEAIQTTAGANFTTEPTPGDVLEDIEIHPQTGMKWYYPMGDEIKVPGGGRLAIECTAPQVQTVAASMDIEE